jgi:replicative DNA helicase
MSEAKISEVFSKDFQDKVLGCLFRVSEFAAVATQHLRPKYFDGAINQNISKLIIDHYKRFGCCMSSTAYMTEIKTKFKSDEKEAIQYVRRYGELVSGEITDYKYVLENLIDWVKRQQWKRFIEDAAKKHLADDKTPDFKKMEAAANKIININSICDSKPYDYFDMRNAVARAKKRTADLEKSIGIRTGIPELDIKLYGRGFMPGELYLVLAPPKRGKTMALLWFANAAARRGHNVVYFTCEVSTHICASRLDALNSGMEFYDLPRHAKYVATEVTKKIPKKGQLKIFEYPTKSLSPVMAEERINDLIKTDGFIPDIILIDYLDLLRPTARSDNPYIDQGHIAEDLRGIAGKFNCPMVTASQINRGGSSKEVTGGSDVAGSYDKIAIADQIITLSATRDDLKSNRLKINLSESRNNESALLNVETEFSKGCFFKQFLSAS